MSYFVYIVQAKDNSLYTGYTTDIQKRVKTHNKGVYGAKALKGKLPVKLVYSESFEIKNEALKREIEIKSWARSKKLELIARG